jgi:phosphatidylserine/phosphatidylglycerophosphate/cardiolipin synthase-like enzyme
MPATHRPRKQIQYPWRHDTSCRLLIDSERFIPVMLEAIQNARRYILLEMYLVESGHVTDHFIQAIREAAARGVHVYIILDAFGSIRFSQADRKRLENPLIEIATYHPFRWLQPQRYFARDHRKLLLIDGNVAYTGGMGFSDGVRISDTDHMPWHDIVIQSRGSVVSDWQHLFVMQWRHILHVSLDLPICSPQHSNQMTARLVYSQPARINTVLTNLRRHAAHAKYRVWIATAYFLPSWRLRRVLRNAVRRGVDVRILLPGQVTDNPVVRYASQRFYTHLLKAGVKIYEYQPRFMHAKAALGDDWVSIGSSNFDRWSRSRNLEANQEIIDKAFAGEVEIMFRHDFSNARQIMLKDWTARSLLQQWRERFWGTVEAWLNRE